MFFLPKKKRLGPKKMITGISGFGFLSKNGRFVTHICFSKNALLKPLFYSVFCVRAFLAKLSKKGNFGHPPKKRKLIDNWEVLFEYLCVFFVFVFSFFCFLLEGWRVRRGGPKGHLTFFLPVFLFCFVVVPCFCLFQESFRFFLLCFCFMKETTRQYSITKFVCHQSVLFLGFPVLFSLSNPFFLSLLSFVSDFKLCFLININVFGFKNKQVKKKLKQKTPIFGQEGSCNKRFLWTCVLQMRKDIAFFCLFPLLAILVDVQKHYKNGYFNTFFKNNGPKMTIFKRHHLGQGRVVIWDKLVSPNNNLAQIITIQYCARTFFCQTKICWNPYSILLFWQTLLF